jgi:DNA-binding MarR family transcriptional regulator
LSRRKTDPLDRRSVIVQQTAAGRAYLREFGDILVLASDSVIEEP